MATVPELTGIDADGSGDVDLADLNASDAQVSVDGSGDLTRAG